MGKALQAKLNLKNLFLKGKRVLMRVDFNAPDLEGLLRCEWLCVKWPITLFVFLCSLLNGLDINMISKEDRDSLEKFFKLLMREEVLSYTLFGQKPISVADFGPPSYCFPFLTMEVICEKGWSAWVKHRDLFPSSSFVLKREVLENGSSHFYLINKQATLKMIRQNKDLFQSEMTSEQILDQLCDSTQKVTDTLSSQLLLGLFLGYGKENALNFDREEMVCKAIVGKMVPPFQLGKLFDSLCSFGQWLVNRSKFRKSNIMIERSAADLVRECNELCSKRKIFYEDHFVLDQFNYPQFIYWDDCLETVRIREDYLKTRSKLQEAYKTGGSFLEVTLKQWINP